MAAVHRLTSLLMKAGRGALGLLLFLLELGAGCVAGHAALRMQPYVSYSLKSCSVNTRVSAVFLGAEDALGFKCFWPPLSHVGIQYLFTSEDLWVFFTQCDTHTKLTLTFLSVYRAGSIMHADFEVFATAHMTVISLHSVLQLSGCEMTESELMLISSQM